QRLFLGLTEEHQQLQPRAIIALGLKGVVTQQQ
ncbi:MAG: hypothetical protein UT38_C0007G0001, partial [Microgenomates group bacterium GW2011_GWA2_39_19]